MSFANLAFAVTNRANTEILFSVDEDKTVTFDTAVCNTALSVPPYSASSLPTASPAGRIIFVADAAGGATIAFSDGTDWRSVVDRAVIT